MENMFIWILIFAGAIIGLLGTFLIASERELKKTRAAVEDLAAKLESTPEVRESTPVPVAETEQSAELIAKNRELENEVSSLSSRLHASETAREELAAVQNQLSACQLEKNELQKANQDFQNEIGLLKHQLETNLSRLNESGDEHQQLVARAAEYETENAGLKRVLEQGQSRIQALESKETQWAEIQTRDATLKEQQQRLESEITDLKQQLTSARQALSESEGTQAQLRKSESSRNQLANDTQRLECEITSLNEQLASARQALHESEATQTQLRESERSLKQLADEYRRLQQESSSWQERLAVSEEQRRRLSGLRDSLKGLRIKQAAIVETNRQLQEDLTALTESVQSPASPGAVTVANSASPTDGSQSRENDLNARDAMAVSPQLDDVSSVADENAEKSGAKRRRFGIFPG